MRDSRCFACRANASSTVLMSSASAASYERAREASERATLRRLARARAQLSKAVPRDCTTYCALSSAAVSAKPDSARAAGAPRHETRSRLLCAGGSRRDAELSSLPPLTVAASPQHQGYTRHRSIYSPRRQHPAPPQPLPPLLALLLAIHLVHSRPFTLRSLCGMSISASGRVFPVTRFPPDKPLEWTARTKSPLVQDLVRRREAIFDKQREADDGASPLPARRPTL